MMRAGAYNCAFRSHHLLRFNGWVSGSSLSFFGSQSAVRASKSVQRASKSVSSGFPRCFLTPSALRSRFGPRLGPNFRHDREAWDLKNQGILRDVLNFLRFRPFLLESPPGPDSGHPKDLQDVPRGSPESSKIAPGVPPDSPKSLSLIHI